MPADPTPAPEWAVKMAFSDVFPSYVKRLGYEGARHELRYIGPESWALMERLALSYASVRDATLREAAARCGERAKSFDNATTDGATGRRIFRAHALEARACGGAILSLVGTAPKQTQSAAEAEGREEAPRG